MRRAVLALPLAALLLHCDRLLPASPDLRRAARLPLELALARLPARDTGRFGRAGDPLNLVFVGSRADVERMLRAAGWTPLSLSVAGAAREGLADLLAGRRLERFPPMNDYRVGGRVQDMNWVRVVVPLSSRHHFRLWRTALADPKGRELWWGSGNFDRAIRWRDLSHVPDPDMDAERDFVASTLAGLAALRLEALPQIPLGGANDKGYAFRTDGRALVAEAAAPGR